MKVFSVNRTPSLLFLIFLTWHLATLINMSTFLRIFVYQTKAKDSKLLDINIPCIPTVSVWIAVLGSSPNFNYYVLKCLARRSVRKVKQRMRSITSHWLILESPCLNLENLVHLTKGYSSCLVTCDILVGMQGGLPESLVPDAWVRFEFLTIYLFVLVLHLIFSFVFVYS